MSETDFLKLKKHDNVETNTEKFDIENYLNGNWDKIDENVGEVNTNISNINSKSTELEKELKEAQEDFYQNSIRGQASGEYIHVEDSSNCRARIGIGGNSEQETRIGKNLLELMEGTYSNNGITAVVKDGVITLNGTATAISFVSVNLLKSFNLVTGTTYHLSIFNTETVGDSSNICALRINQEGTKQAPFDKINSNLAIIGNLLFSYITIRTPAGITYNNFVIKPQFEIGNGTNEWKQGGVSPSPDYQSPVKTVGSNANIFDKDTTTDGKYIGEDGSIQAEATVMCSDYIEIETNKDYYISGRTNWQSIGIYDASKTFLNRIVTTQANGIFNITNSNCKYIRVNALIIDKDTLKIEKGSIKTPYSKYCQGSVKVTKCNKNILKNTAVSGKLNGVNRTVKEDGSVIINGTSTAWANLTVGTIQGDGNSYILSGSPSNSEIFLTVNNTKEGDIAQSKNGSDAIFLPLKGSTYSVIVCIPSKKTFNNEVVKPLIRTVNDEDNTYIKHQEQTYIMPVQQEMLEDDYFDWDNEEEVHTWNKLVLDGTETFNSWTGKAPSGYSVFFSKILINTINSQGDLKCNALKYIENPWESGKNAIGLQRTFKELYISIESKYASTLEEFKTYLKSQYDTGTPVIIYYMLATPTRLAFTDDQKAVAKELNNARTYKNVTNITTDSIAILDLDYAKDLEELTEYSTEERVIGRWIDGKPLYSKVGSIKFTSVYDSSGLHTRGSLIDSDIDYGTVSKVLNKNLLSSSLFNTYGTSTSNVYVENRQGNSNKGYILGFTDRTDLLNTTIYVVVEYTKTTD